MVSVLLSPLSLYSWLTATLLQFVLSVPALVLSSLHYSVLLLLACLWCIADIFVSLLLMALNVALYLLHLALVVGVVAILTLARHKMAVGKKVLYQQRTFADASLHTKTTLSMFAPRVAKEA